jgi:hypothetical protein
MYFFGDIQLGDAFLSLLGLSGCAALFAGKPFVQIRDIIAA